VLTRGAFLGSIVNFIAEHLPLWRDHPDRRQVKAERELTTQLIAFLNSAARSGSLDIVQFIPEAPDSVERQRSLDISVQPCGRSILVEGCRYTQFDTLLPIECKRLPMPGDHRRDEREYVTSSSGTSGGIQRFKLGAHGSSHSLGVMIGYIQDGRSYSLWLDAINTWLREVAREDPQWVGEALIAERLSDVVHRLRSSHRRTASRSDVELRHLWIHLEPDA